MHRAASQRWLIPVEWREWAEPTGLSESAFDNHVGAESQARSTGTSVFASAPTVFTDQKSSPIEAVDFCLRNGASRSLRSEIFENSEIFGDAVKKIAKARGF